MLIAFLGWSPPAHAQLVGAPLKTYWIRSGVPFIVYWCASAGNQIDSAPAGSVFIASMSTTSSGSGFCGTWINMASNALQINGYVYSDQGFCVDLGSHYNPNPSGLYYIASHSTYMDCGGVSYVYLANLSMATYDPGGPNQETRSWQFYSPTVSPTAP